MAPPTDDAASAATTTTDASPPPPPPPTLDLPLHHLLRTLQLQNGLRHGDYQRYRHYTTRRLQRLRRAAKATHKGGKAFTTKSLHTLEAIGGQEKMKMEHLLLLLLNAERAWAFAMQLKQDIAANGGHAPSHIRSHLLRRLRRAALWATRLQGLVSEASSSSTTAAKGKSRVTERTALEVEAYAGWMASLLDVEQENWSVALTKLRTAHSILSKMGEVGSLEDQDLFSNKADEVLQSMRYCQYNLGESSSESLVEDLRNHADRHVPQALKDKLEAVLEASRKEEATGLDHVVWGPAGGGGGGGEKIPVSSAEVRVALVKVNDAIKGLKEGEEGGEEERDASYAQVYAAYDDALRRVQEETKKLEGMSHGTRVEATKEEVRLLGSYLQHGKLETMMARNQALVQRLLSSFSISSSSSAKKSTATATGRPEDLVHVYDALLQNASDILKLPGVEDVEAVLTHTQALQARYRAHRAFYLAEYYAGGKKQQQQLPEALVLYELAVSLSEEAEALAEEIQGGRKEEKKRLGEEARGLKDLAVGGRYRAQALSLLASLGSNAGSGGGAGAGAKGNVVATEEEALTAAMAALALGAAAAAAAAAASADENGGSGGGEANTKKDKKKKGGASKNKPTSSNRTLLERLGELDGGKESEGFGIAHVPPTMTPVRAKPQVFDIAFNYLDARLPDLAAKAGIAKKKGDEKAGGGLFGWLRG